MDASSPLEASFAAASTPRAERETSAFSALSTRVLARTTDALRRMRSLEREALGLDVHDATGSDRFSAPTPSQLRHRFIQIHVVDQRFKEPSWMHPNLGGEAQYVHSTPEELDALRAKMLAEKHNLGEWSSTAISGNDVLSSVLFTAGLLIDKAGKLAPVAQLIVVLVIYCFRWVFEEAVSAVPLNGGCYNILLNAASKKTAAVAATFSILCYLATGVVCGVSAFNYVNSLLSLPVVACTVGLLLAFALLCLMGIAESAVVALVFFLFHVFTLSVLCIFSLIYMIQNPSIMWDNLQTSLPSTLIGGHLVDGNVFTSIFLGLGPAMLSVTGFETSPQFIEEQAPGAFPKTLRNNWALSGFFNMATVILALGVVPIAEVEGKKDVLLAYMGRITSGHWLEILVTVDAFVVLAGAVLTSYVGINGLAQRLAIDRVLPRFLLQQNSCRKTNHYIILSYFVVASSLVVTLNAKVGPLSGVFGFAFLGVMASFALGCILLKIGREDIPRATRTSWTNVTFCLLMVFVGMVANALGDISSLGYFAAYYLGVLLVVMIMLERVTLLKFVLYVSKQLIIYFRYERSGRAMPPLPTQHSLVSSSTPSAVARGHGVIGSVMVAKSIERIKKTPVIFFCKSPNLPKINEAISYVIHNEQTYCLRLVHVISPTSREEVPREFEDIVCLFDHIYPSIKIDFVAVTGVFDPAMIEWISANMNIPTNMMFMRQPVNSETHAVAAAGVRVITN